MSQDRVSIGVVEDSTTLIVDLVGRIARNPRYSLAFVVSSLSHARGVLANSAPDVLLCDLGLPDGSGVSIIEEVCARFPNCDVLVWSSSSDDESIVRCIEAGAKGYLVKGDRGMDFDTAIDQLTNGGSPLTPSVARKLLKRLKAKDATAPVVPVRERAVMHTECEVANLAEAKQTELLTGREVQTLNLIARGYTYSEIANLLGVRLHTVRTHVRNLYGKLSVHSRSEAIFEATQIGLLNWRETAQGVG